MESSGYPLGQLTYAGSCIQVEGVIEKLLAPKEHKVALKAEKILHVGSVELGKYPLAKSGLSLDFIRPYPHFRPRTSTVIARF